MNQDKTQIPGRRLTKNDVKEIWNITAQLVDRHGGCFQTCFVSVREAYKARLTMEDEASQ